MPEVRDAAADAAAEGEAAGGVVTFGPGYQEGRQGWGPALRNGEVYMPRTPTPTEPVNEEAADILKRFRRALRGPVMDGQNKRAAGTKVRWDVDEHEPAMFRHLERWQRGERVDGDSGYHPLVHVACRALMIALQETGDVPEPEA